MKSIAPRAASLLMALFLCLSTSIEARAADGIAVAGNLLQYVLPATAAGLTLVYQDGKGALQFAESAALASGVTYGLKYAVDERRPEGGRYSFPSGHTSISFCAAEFIRRRYGWEYGIAAYAVASFVAYSRFETDKHYPQDIVAGAAIGFVSSNIFTRPYRGWHLQAEADGMHYGVSLVRVW
jgi:membrane-associated phospholipid phosphatase